MSLSADIVTKLRAVAKVFCSFDELPNFQSLFLVH